MDEKKEVILKLENICQSYVVGNDVKDAVDNVSLEVYDNEFLVVLGPGHCGKTVLMNTIAGIEKPIGGKIFLEGQEVHGSDSRIGMVFQSLDLMFWQTVMGNVEFGLRLQGVKKEERRKGGIFKDVEPHDIVKFGLIPELVGRIPVIVTLNDLDEQALVRILREPRSSIIKQYLKLFEMDGVELEFTDDALKAIASLAIQRNTGARGLRSIMEKLMMSIMYDIPSHEDIVSVTINGDCVNGISEPIITRKELLVKANEVCGELQ